MKSSVCVCVTVFGFVQQYHVFFSLAFIFVAIKKWELNILPWCKLHQKEVKPTRPCRVWAFGGVRGESFVGLKPSRQQCVSDLFSFPFHKVSLNTCSRIAWDGLSYIESMCQHWILLLPAPKKYHKERKNDSDSDNRNSWLGVLSTSREHLGLIPFSECLSVKSGEQLQCRDLFSGACSTQPSAVLELAQACAQRSSAKLVWGLCEGHCFITAWSPHFHSIFGQWRS